MKRKLTRTTNLYYYHFANGKEVDGAPPGVTGDLTGITGDLTGISGDLTGVKGDVDECGLTNAERDRGVDITELIAGEENDK